MSFGNPLGLLGLLAIGVPILIHLLGRFRSRIEKFPTLRFVGTSRLNPTRRRRISDWPLLIVRCAIVAAAAIALSQPSFGNSSGASAAVSRVVIVDTSASMPRPADNGAVADSGLANVTGRLVFTDSPVDAIPGAVAWLATRRGLREIAIVSDFQRSAMDSAALTNIPDDIGLALRMVAGVRPRLATAPRYRISAQYGPTDSPGVGASWRAIGRSLPADSAPQVTIVYRGHASFDSLSRGSALIDSAWMARLVTSLQQDKVVAATRAFDSVVARRAGDRLVLLASYDAGGVASAALNDALTRAVTPRIPGAEFDSTRWTTPELQRWERPAREVSAPSATTSSGRWFWALCLALLALETWMRSRARRPSAPAAIPAPAVEERAA